MEHAAPPRLAPEAVVSQLDILVAVNLHGVCAGLYVCVGGEEGGHVQSGVWHYR